MGMYGKRLAIIFQAQAQGLAATCQIQITYG